MFYIILYFISILYKYYITLPQQSIFGGLTEKILDDIIIPNTEPIGINFLFFLFSFFLLFKL